MNASDQEQQTDPAQTDHAETTGGTAPRLIGPVSRRTALKGLFIVAGAAGILVAGEVCAGGLIALYEPRTRVSGGSATLGRKSAFYAAMPSGCKLNSAGVFYREDARSFLVHLSAQTPWQLSGDQLATALATQNILRDADGSYWAVVSQACPHEGVTVRFFPCGAFNCPSCGSSFAVDGEYLDGPAPHSLNRYAVAISGQYVVADTGALDMSVDRPDALHRLLAAPSIIGCFHYDA